MLFGVSILVFILSILWPKSIDRYRIWNCMLFQLLSVLPIFPKKPIVSLVFSQKYQFFQFFKNFFNQISSSIWGTSRDAHHYKISQPPPPHCSALVQLFFQLANHFFQSLSGIAFRRCVDSAFTVSTSPKWVPRKEISIYQTERNHRRPNQVRMEDVQARLFDFLPKSGLQHTTDAVVLCHREESTSCFSTIPATSFVHARVDNARSQCRPCQWSSFLLTYAQWVWDPDNQKKKNNKKWSP